MAQQAAYAKVNLYLHITGKRHDGYHTLDSLLAYIDLYDTITITPSTHMSCLVTGTFAPLLMKEQDNIVLKAARLIAQQCAKPVTPVQITIEKNIPVGAGLGGGSTDAAAVLSLLPKWWQIDIHRQTLKKMAHQLGADIPFFFEKKAAFIEGIGSPYLQIEESLPDLPMIIIYPQKPVATADVYKKEVTKYSVARRFQKDSLPSNQKTWLDLLNKTENHLTDNAIDICPDIAKSLEFLVKSHDCLVARMSGSGSACFALYNDIDAQKKAYLYLKENAPSHWWLYQTRFIQEVPNLDS